MNNRIAARTWIIRWMYASAVAHLAIGLLLPWISGLPVFASYHHGIDIFFWGREAPAAARAQQIWWMSLFGPTVQVLALWMMALIRAADKEYRVSIWAWLIVGILIWAPQDMLISLRASCWPHVWIDCLAVITMVPPLIWLWMHDRRQAMLARLP